MERYFQRESVLLGYSPQNSFRDHTTSPETQSDDIDFNDVFGGPPRRSSAQETRLSFNETADYSGFGDDDEISSRDSWKGLSEKPVFGDEGLRRRRYASDNFFHDIFKGKDSLSSSPRKREWDLVSSSPSTRVLSPSRPLPAKADPIGSPLPAPFSLPAKLTKVVELPTFGSAAEVPHGSKDSAPNVTSHDSSSPQSRSSSPNQSRKNKNDTRTSYRQSLLSQEISLSSNESANVSKDNEMKESHCPEPPKNSNQFHFSIYKWASNGIPLVMPLKGGNGSKLKENSHSISEKSSKFNIKKPVTDDHKPSNGSIPDISTQDDEPWQIVDHADVVSPSLGEKTKTSSLSQTGSRGTLEEKVSETTEEAHKPEVKPLYSFFYDNNYKISGNEKISKSSEKGGTVKSSTEKSSTVPDFFKNLKKQDVKRSGSGCVEAAKGGLGGSALNSGDPGKTRSKGKVKEFVKIFNEETSSKPKIGSDTHSQSSRRKESDTSKEEKEVNFNKKGAEEKVDLHNMHEKKSPAYASIGGNKNTQKRERQQPDTKNAPSPNGFRATFGDRRESLQDFEIKDLTQAENDQPKAGNDSDETQAIDAKIRKWSNGKEGNIRSLLSTLQYVLWPGSGWKPVPLVDIIEGSAVKRSYQKALLCLHPDKLQQKGAASHQKYIAEKVFDLLQDAWDHFNSLGT